MQADFLTLHTPLTEETRRMIGSRELSLMKKSALLINTARGGIVDDRALVKALDEGGLAGAGIDVFETEPPEDPSLRSHPENTLHPPHRRPERRGPVPHVLGGFRTGCLRPAGRTAPGRGQQTPKSAVREDELKLLARERMVQREASWS